MTTIAGIPLQRVIGVGWLLVPRRCPNRRPDALRRRIRQRMPSSGASRLSHAAAPAGRPSLRQIVIASGFASCTITPQIALARSS